MDFALSASGQLLTIHLQTLWVLCVAVELILLAMFLGKR